MDRAERLSFGLAVIAHGVLFAALAVGLTPRDPAPQREAVAVTLAEDFGEFAAATEAPAAASADRSLEDDLESMEPPKVEPLPQPTITPTPAPPQPTVERRPETRQDRQPDQRSQRRSSRIANITDGIGRTSDSGSSTNQASISTADRNSLITRITNAIRPCYNLGSLSGTAAEDIIVRLRLQPDRDGRLSRRQVTVMAARGVNASNRAYQQQMIEAARSAVLNPRCRLRNLPDAMYEGGWSDVTLNFRPAQLT
jgi:hypothetical protein